jgi:hypothetical protein
MPLVAPVTFAILPSSLLDGKICRLGALENPVNVPGCAPVEIGITDCVANEPTGVDEFSGRIDRQCAMLLR